MNMPLFVDELTLRDTVSRNITKLAFDFNLSQADLSRMTGLPQATVSNWMLGKSIPKASALCKLADCFDVSVYMILGRGA